MARRVRTDKELYNAGVVKWGKARTQDFHAAFAALKIASGPNSAAVHSGYGKDEFGEINRLSFYMPRVMVFVQKGVGSGWPISRAGSSGQMSRNGGRVPKDWFNGPVEKHFPELVDHVANAKADAIVSNILIK